VGDRKSSARRRCVLGADGVRNNAGNSALRQHCRAPPMEMFLLDRAGVDRYILHVPHTAFVTLREASIEGFADLLRSDLWSDMGIDRNGTRRIHSDRLAELIAHNRRSFAEIRRIVLEVVERMGRHYGRRDSPIEGKASDRDIAISDLNVTVLREPKNKLQNCGWRLHMRARTSHECAEAGDDRHRSSVTRRVDDAS